MTEKYEEAAVITVHEKIADQIYSMWLQTEEISAEAKPGQFVSLYCKDESRMLPRPISICEIQKETGRIRLVYRVIGKGTEEFSKYEEGMTVRMIGPLGNGFPLKKKKALLIGGGIGIPPMVQLAKQLEGEVQIAAGYRDELFLVKELQENGKLIIATEDGSSGTKGTVLDAIRENGIQADIIYACGPTPMLKAIKAYALEEKIEAWLSLEEKMACGIGACLACVCKTSKVDSHSKVNNARVCKEGPVFPAEEVEL